jgi:hypothetical protein
MARGASSKALARIGPAVSGTIPEELLGLLQETNGITSGDGAKLIWSVADVVSQNLAFRDPAQVDAGLYRPFHSLLLFGEIGNGDLFAYDMTGRVPLRPTIIIWDHETDERSSFASDLREYLRLRGASGVAVGGDTVAAAEVERRVVSVWVGSHGSQTALNAYLAAGESGRVSADGLPLSRFQAEWQLSLKDLIGSEEHALFLPRPTRVARLLEGVHGGHSFGAAAAKRATEAGRARATSAILVYGLKYKGPTVAHSSGVAFVGCFEFE